MQKVQPQPQVSEIGSDRRGSWETRTARHIVVFVDIDICKKQIIYFSGIQAFFQITNFPAELVLSTHSTLVRAGYR